MENLLRYFLYCPIKLNMYILWHPIRIAPEKVILIDDTMYS